MSSGTCQFDEEANVLANASELANSLGLRVEQIHKFTQLFIQTARNELLELEKAIHAQDLSAIAKIGHRMKSSSSTIGAYQFAELCKILESLKTDGDVNQASALFAQLQSLLTRIEACHVKRAP